VKVAVLAGVPPDQLTQQLIEAGVAAMTQALRRHRPEGPGVGHLTGAMFGARTVLFHLGVLDAPPRRQQPNLQAARDAAWARVPPRLATTLRDYIAQLRLSLRPATMVRVEGVLREFAGWLAAHAPDVGAVADLRRPHIEAYKLPSRRPALGPRRAAVQDQPRGTPGHPAHLLRAAHRVGRPGHPRPRAGVLR
jgi:hypothetical protein